MSKIIGIHSGTFHCDDALACYLLKLTSEFKDADIIRSRNPKALDQCDILVDVGGIYDPENYKFDHHQKEFNETLNDDYEIKLSSAGLIYKHFGREIICNIINANIELNDISDNPELIDKIFFKIYKSFIKEIDAIDNGISQYDEIEPKFHINTDLSSRVKKLNPSWNNPECDTDEQFSKAIEFPIAHISTSNK